MTELCVCLCDASSHLDIHQSLNLKFAKFPQSSLMQSGKKISNIGLSTKGMLCWVQEKTWKKIAHAQMCAPKTFAHVQEMPREIFAHAQMSCANRNTTTPNAQI